MQKRLITSLFCFSLIIWCNHFGPVLYHRLNRKISSPSPLLSHLSRNFALQASGTGAQDVRILTSPTYAGQSAWWSGFYGRQVPSPPSIVLQDGFGLSECWAFQGGSGTFGIALDKVINISHISIDHAPASYGADVTNAPRSMLLWGLAEGSTNAGILTKHSRRFVFPNTPPAFQLSLPKAAEPIGWAPLLHFQYDVKQDQHLQVFEIPLDIRSLGISCGIVVVQILDNWGSGESTCIYRVGIYSSSNK